MFNSVLNIFALYYLNYALFQNHKNRYDLSHSVVSTVHAIIGVKYAIDVLQDNEFWNNHISHVSNKSINMIDFTMSYFLYDVLKILLNYKYLQKNILFLIHGGVCLTLYTLANVYNILHFYGAFFLIWEASTPFINYRYIFKEIGFNNRIIINVNNLCIFIVFFLCRIIWGGYGAYLYYNDFYVSNNELPFINVFTTSYLIMYSLTWFWFLKMCNILYMKCIKSS